MHKLSARRVEHIRSRYGFAIRTNFSRGRRISGQTAAADDYLSVFR